MKRNHFLCYFINYDNKIKEVVGTDQGEWEEEREEERGGEVAKAGKGGGEQSWGGGEWRCRGGRRGGSGRS